MTDSRTPSRTPSRTLKQRLSHLTYTRARTLLGTRGDLLLRDGGSIDIDPGEQVTVDKHQFRLQLADALVTITAAAEKGSGIIWACSCRAPQCVHAGAAFALILEEKVLLGLAEPPPERVAIESLSDEELVNQAIDERRERAGKEKMRVKSLAARTLWTDYLVTNSASGKSYKVALRGWLPGESYCSCPDYRKNTLGTCKHILHVIGKVEKRFSNRQKEQPYRHSEISVHLLYLETLELRLLMPDEPSPAARKLLKPLAGKPVGDISNLLKRIRKLALLGETVTIYPDAQHYIEQRLLQQRMAAITAEIRKDPEKHPLRTSLLKVDLLPYQLDGIAFACAAGRAVLADDMGLGKTIQGIGVAELLARQAGLSRVLVITPASLKTQWRIEIERFSERDSLLVLGNAGIRADQYAQGAFFTICNYEQVLRDRKVIDSQHWDLIILDEGQRIRNWGAKTTQAIKSLTSMFALVLTGTPLENRLDDLYSVVEFIDDRHLGPAFRFYNHHRVVDEKGKVLGYKNLAELNRSLSPLLLRRTRKSVHQDLPSRQTEVIRIIPTDEQVAIHDAQARVIRSILAKKYISEMDLLRLQKALLVCRMAANSTYLVDKIAPGYSTKLAELDNLFEQLSQEADRKVLLFSEWTTMLNLIEPLLEKHGMEFVRLDGSVPQKKRQGLVKQFQNEQACRVFITTNAGSTGLNLQAANTVINVDLPWNPAILEQRISRAHRMGQKRHVQVFVLLTEQTIEERLLATLAAKQQLAIAALDPDSDIDEVDLVSGIEELRRRLEVLLGPGPEAAVDETSLQQVEKDLNRQDDISRAGGQMLTAAFQFLNQLLPAADDSPENLQLAEMITDRLTSCLEEQEDGSLKLSVTLPGKDDITNLAATVARLIATG